MSAIYETINTQPCALRDISDDGSPPFIGKSTPENRPESGTSEGSHVLVCKICRSIITRRDLGMEVEGKHRHVFFNPYGYVFELGCFASAKNIRTVGPKSNEFTWFAGFDWQVIGCTGCSTQLGWRYTSNIKGGFYGLILANLIEEEERS